MRITLIEGSRPRLIQTDPKSAISGPNRVKIRSESGLNQVWREGFGGGRVQRGRSGWEGSVAPRKVLSLAFPEPNPETQRKHTLRANSEFFRFGTVGDTPTPRETKLNPSSEKFLGAKN